MTQVVSFSSRSPKPIARAQAIVSCLKNACMQYLYQYDLRKKEVSEPLRSVIQYDTSYLSTSYESRWPARNTYTHYEEAFTRGVLQLLFNNYTLALPAAFSLRNGRRYRRGWHYAHDLNASDRDCATNKKLPSTATDHVCCAGGF